MEGEVSVLLYITVIIGTILMGSLLVCYICVFRQLCCSPDIESYGSRTNRSSKRGGYGGRNSLNLGELTQISSQPTETEKL